MARSFVACLLLVGLVAAEEPSTSVTPVEKVITLLENLKSEVEGEGQAEATTYDKFACWCRDTTKSKSSSITGGRDNINSLSADIQEKTASKEEKEAELKKRQGDHEAWTAELQDTEARFAKATAEYEAEAADLSKAISSLSSAIQAMGDSKPSSLLAIRQTVEQSLALATAMNIITEPKRKAVSAFLQTGTQVDPNDPTYAYHSQGIIDTLQKLLKEFRDEKQDLDNEWTKAKKTYQDTIESLQGKLKENKEAMDNLEGDIEGLKGQIAKARSDLVSAEELLKDDQLYMKDMTERCELRANEWDQRSQMRSDELAALAGALEVIKGKVKSSDEGANKRALLLERNASQGAAGAAAQKASTGDEGKASLAAISPHSAAPAFLQEAAASAAASGSGRSLLRGAHAAALTAQAKQDKVVSFLGGEGRRLRSTALSALAMSVASDPFGKVKTLIQQLIERLLHESTSEATKKGFCDEELGKAKKDRDFRLADTTKLDVEIKGLNLKKDELEAEIELLTGQIKTLKEDLKEATSQRGEEHDENMKTIKTSLEGFDATKQALQILKIFYKNAAKAKTSLLQASPIDEATDGAGFDGAYAGKQERSKGVIGMLQVIQSDFERTARHTEAAEKKAQEEFVEFDRVSRADIGGKEMKKQLDEDDLKTTINTIEAKMDDLSTAQALLDSALKTLEDLKPTCIDTAMSYEDRVAKREDEIAALKKALCILDGEGIEPECQ